MKSRVSEEESASTGLPLSSRPRLAVFGGSFDPVHNGHLFLAGEVVRAGLVEEVLFVPARRPPHKSTRELAAAAHRSAMLKDALAPFPEFSLSDIELERTEEMSYTFDTLSTLARAFTEHELFFLMGMDSLVDLHTWYKSTELAGTFGFLIYPRPGVQTPAFAVLRDRFGAHNARKLLDSILDAQSIPIVATEIRRDCREGVNLAGRIPESVLHYIREHQLYGCEAV